MDIRYRPFIGHASNMIQGFRCQPFIRDHEGREFGIETVLGHRGNIENTAERNAAVLSVAFKTLARAIGQKQSMLLIVPVNSIALASRDFRQHTGRQGRAHDQSVGPAVDVEQSLVVETQVDRLPANASASASNGTPNSSPPRATPISSCSAL